MALTAKQAAFVAEYLIDLNATQAAIRAGYSEATAHSQGPRLLDNVEVAAAIAAANNSRISRVQVDADYVLKRLFEMAEADRADLYDANGDLLPVKKWPEVWRKGMVGGIKIEALFDGTGKDRVQIGHTKEVKTVDTLSILQTLGKHIKVNAFQEVVKVDGVDALADRMERALRRLEGAGK
jgi:Phage terminase, small subunit